MPPILPYEPTPQPPPTTLSLETNDNHLRITFPVWPKWIIYGAMALWGGITMVWTAAFIVVAWELHRMHQIPLTSSAITTPMDAVDYQMLLWLGTPVLLFWVVDIFFFLRYRRWGQIPQRLEVHEQSWTLTQPGRWGPRYKRWTANDVRDIRLHQPKSLLPGRYAAQLRIRLHTRSAVCFRFSTRDPTLADRIADALNKKRNRHP